MARSLSERAHAAVEQIQEDPVRFSDRMFFLFGTIASGWLAFILLHQMLEKGWHYGWIFIPFWLIVAYLILPRIHSVLSRIYLPDYFIGRTRTREGVLGDPVNVGFRGDEDAIHAAMLRAGWHRADELNLFTGWKIVRSTLTRRTYPDAPVSALFLFGRRQRFTYQQEVAGNPRKRHHVRFWPAPEGWRLPGGAKVDWLAAGTYDRDVGLSWFTLQVTHRIDADVDAERDHIVATLINAASGNEGIEVQILRHFSSGYHHRNGGGDRIRTDGDLPIVDLRHVSAPPASIRGQIEEDRREAAYRRRVPLTVGFAVLMMAASAAISAVVAFLGFRSGVDDVATSALLEVVLAWGLSPSGAGIALLGTMITMALGYVVLIVFVYRGSRGARTLTMVLSTLGVVFWVDLWIMVAERRASMLNLVSVAVEILVLLALSSDAARRYAGSSAAHKNDPGDDGEDRSG